jgi:hypothetical protein
MLSSVGLSLIHFGDRPERTFLNTMAEDFRSSQTCRMEELLFLCTISLHGISFPSGTVRAGLLNNGSPGLRLACN